MSPELALALYLAATAAAALLWLAHRLLPYFTPDWWQS